MKQLLLTGATGFIGRHLVRRLLTEGYSVWATRRAESNVAVLGADASRVRWVDAGSSDSVEAAFRDTSFTAIIHLATAYGRGDQPASEVVKTNLLFPVRLLELAIENGTELFLTTDTCFTPDYPYLRAYTLSKTQFGQWGQVIAESTSTRFMTIELQHPYGPGDGKGKFVPWIIDRCLNAGDPIELTSGEQAKDFIYIDDVINAYEVICRRWADLPTSVAVVPCGTGKAVRVRDFVESVGRVCGDRVGLDFGALDPRPGEVMRSVADTSYLQSLGWVPKVSLEEGIARTVAAERSRGRAAGVSER